MSRKRPRIYIIEIVPPEEDPVFRIQRLITAAELKSLVATPVTILPAPGPGKFYALQNVFSFYTFLTTPFNLQGHSRLQFNSPGLGQVEFQLGGLIDQTFNTLSASYGQVFGTPGSEWVNQPLTVFLNPPTEMTAGLGSLLLVVYYSIEATT